MVKLGRSMGFNLKWGFTFVRVVTRNFELLLKKLN